VPNTAFVRGISPLVVLVGIASWAAVRTCHAPSTVPNDAAWQRAVAYVAPQLTPGATITFAPAWIDPVGRLHAGKHLPVGAIGGLDLATFDTIWQFSIRDAKISCDGVITDDKTFAGVRVTRCSRPAELVIWRLIDSMTQRGGNGIRTDGKLARGPSVELAEVGFTPRRCVQLVPQPGQTVALELTQLTLGSKLAVGVGLADVFTRRDVRAPGSLAVFIDDKPVAQRSFGVDDGWVRFDVATTPGKHRVRFEATAVGATARDRLICFAAEAWL
jgi:hypothetical protein